MADDALIVAGKIVEVDARGYLLRFDDWDRSVAHHIASQHQIELTEAHWHVLDALRQFYLQYQLAPSMRPLIKYLQSSLSGEKISSLYLMQLFPGSPATLSAKIAGLPRPDNCL